jgi:hypothetical protein
MISFAFFHLVVAGSGRSFGRDRQSLVQAITHPNHDFTVLQFAHKSALNVNATAQQDRFQHWNSSPRSFHDLDVGRFWKEKPDLLIIVSRMSTFSPIGCKNAGMRPVVTGLLPVRALNNGYSQSRKIGISGRSAGGIG